MALGSAVTVTVAVTVGTGVGGGDLAGELSQKAVMGVAAVFGGHPFGVGVGQLVLVGALFAVVVMQLGEFGGHRGLGRSAAESEDRVGEGGHLIAGSVAAPP